MIDKIWNIIKNILNGIPFNLIYKKISSVNYFSNINNIISKILDYYNKFVTNKEIKNLTDKQIENLDVKNARERDLKFNYLYGTNKRANFLFFLTVFAFLFSIIILFFYIEDLSYEGIILLTTVIGFLGKCLYKAYTFEFGGNSNDLDETIQNTNEWLVKEEPKAYDTNKNKKSK